MVFSSASTVILVFVAVVVIVAVAIFIGAIVAFCVCWMVVVAGLMRVFSILVLLFAPYFTANSVDK